MASKSQRQFWPSKRTHHNRTSRLRNYKTRAFSGFTFLLLCSLMGMTVFTVNAGRVSLPGDGSAAKSNAAPRTFKIVAPLQGCAGFFGHVRIDLESEGNEAGASFTVEFDPLVLTNPVATRGPAAIAGNYTLSRNLTQVATGKIGILLDQGEDDPYPAPSPPDRTMVNITFNVVSGAPALPTALNFVSSPTTLSSTDKGGQSLTNVWQGGSLSVGGTACTTSARVGVSGRVTTASGQGLRSAAVTITDSEGNQRKVMTSSLGYYQFDEVDSGKSYVVGVSSRRYRFESRVVQVADNLTDLDFVGIE